ncbi:MAG TPA: OmpA family protein [Stellaceae bacterium]|jgi:outer membrane protein OmpA-like peptidoglycan-associated protein
MKRVLLAALAILGAGLWSPAGHAQDWTGPYLGVQGGYGWGESTGGLRVSGFQIPYDPKPSGPIGGVHLGYDYQWRHLIIGAVVDAEGSDLKGSFTTSTAVPFTTKVSNNFDASIRGKLGFALDRFQIYGTGGVAFGEVKAAYSCPTCFHAPNAFDTEAGMRVGWTAGGGASVLIDPKWSTNVEYRYTRYNIGGSFSDPVTTATDSGAKLAFNAVTLGISYHFLPRRPPAPEPEPIVPATAAVPVPPAMAPPMPSSYLVFFDFDRYTLTPEARAVVEQAAKTFAVKGYARIEVNGYTDLSGTQEYNLKLSQRRATAVAEYLAHLGVPRPVMNVMWHGKENPRVPTADGVRDPHNRRVEIVMP